MSEILTVDDLVTIVREDLDEANIASDTTALLLRKLNRAQRRAMRKIMARYPELFMVETGSTARPDVTTTEGTTKYDFPTDMYGLKFKNIHLVYSDDTHDDLERLLPSQKAQYYTSSPTNRPRKYCVQSRQYEILPPPAGGLTLRLFYTRRPEPMVLQQGRITASGTGYITVNSLGSDLTTVSTNLNNYINVIDYRTGEVKGSCQINSLDTDTNTINIKTSGLTRSTVLGKTISTSIPTDIAVDDYVCTVHGTCIPEIPVAFIDYLTQDALLTRKRTKGEETKEEYGELKDQEEDLQNMGAGQENRQKVKIKNSRRFKRRR